ncbi:uncharacterized protein IAS62_001109 [Cryptococcus decagattii]|uniref:Secreted protein n=1 Tax=Cryptococcus decagattii TaxID=1859122 RepID=A0ABZ2ANL9_9TREE
MGSWPWHSAGFVFFVLAATRFIRGSLEDASARVWIGVPFSQPSGFRRRYEPAIVMRLPFLPTHSVVWWGR